MKTNHPSCKGIKKILIVLLAIINMLFVRNSVITSNVYTDNLTQTTEVVEVIETDKVETEEIIIEEPTETHEEIIARLVHDVDTGKAGNGEARKEYLGEYYSEVQKIINEKYKTVNTAKKSTSSNQSTSSQSKSELQSYAHDLVINTYGWSEYDYDCLVKLWNKESGWNPNAHNKSSGAHGIPQSLPANKMASEGSDYYTNGYTQIRWGLKYIKNRYGTPAKAWSHFQSKNWY